MSEPLDRSARTEPFFRVEDVELSFGALKVLQGVSLEVGRGEIVGLIGPNGAGKTTLFDVISGFREEARGKVWLNGEDLLTRKAWERPWLGLARTFQQVRLYPNLTVYDCIRLSLHRRQPNTPVRSLLKACLGTASSAAEEEQIRAKTAEVIARLGLGDYAAKLASDLSYGTLRMAEIACILALEPELVLLDEPSSGIAQRETEALGPLLQDIRSELGATFVLIEHDMPLIMGISDRIYALANGTILAEGPPEEIQANPAVVESYLGGSFDIAPATRKKAVPARVRRRPLEAAAT
jgi:branched-chain amino acid transport system ATP-binding protein